MAIVILEDDNIKVNVKAGKTMRQIAFQTGASMEFGCRVGDCATCVAKVVSGMEYLSSLSPKEKNAFKMLNMDDESLRLMCQCSVESQEGEIVISYAV